MATRKNGILTLIRSLKTGVSLIQADKNSIGIHDRRTEGRTTAERHYDLKLAMLYEILLHQKEIR